MDTNLEIGQHLVFDTGTGEVLLRVTQITEDKGGRYPKVVMLKWDGSEKRLKRAHRLAAVLETSPMHANEVRGFTLIGEPA